MLFFPSSLRVRWRLPFARIGGVVSLLILFYLAVTATSFLIWHRAAGEFEKAGAELRKWDARARSYAGIPLFAAEMRDTGREAAVSGKSTGQWTRVEELRHLCNQQIDFASGELRASREGDESIQLRKDLATIRSRVEAMGIQTNQVFDSLAGKNIAQARALMTGVERDYEAVAHACGRLETHLETIQQRDRQKQSDAGRMLQAADDLIALLVFVLLGGVTFYWRRLAARIRADMLEKSRLLSQVRDAESKYRAIFDNVVEGVFQMTPDGRFITANRALAAMYGYDGPQELMSELTDVGRQLYADPGRRAELLRLVEKEEVVSGFEAELFRRDGRTIWVAQNVRAVRDESGRLKFIEGTVEEITSRWWAERRRSLLYMTTKVLAESASLAEARPKILQSICEILEWDMGAVWDVDFSASLLRCVEVWHRPNIDIEEFERVTSRMTIERGTGLAGRVWVNGEPDWIADLECQGQLRNARIAVKNGMRSAFGVPVKIGQQVLHVLEFFSPHIPQPDPELLQMLAAIGLQLGQLIERKRQLDALRENEARKAAILESALDCIITFDQDGIVSEFNPAAERTFGYPREFALSKDVVQLVIPPPFREAFRRELAAFGSSPMTPAMGRRNELLAMRADRSEFPAEISYSRINLLGRAMFTVYIRDITERRRAERARAELAAVVESSRDAIVSKTLDGIITSWNSGAERLYGYSAAEAIGRHIYILVPHDRLDELPQTFAAIRRGESLANRETLRVRKDGKRICVSMTESPIRNERGNITGISSIARDMTERKKLEEQLLQSQKMEAVGRLAGGVAHDFNNILTAILGYSDLLLRQARPGDTQYRNLGEIKKAAEFAASLTHQLLAFSRRQCQQLKVLNINDTVAQMQKMLRRLIGEDINIMTVPAAAIGSIKADPGQVEQIILNLAVNARDAMAGGGVLTIETANVSVSPEAGAEINGVPPGEHVRLTISDTGCGMTDEVKEHLFEPFFTTKEKGKGTGLGLATCYGIVTQSGGHIVVDSTVGQGTSFSIFFPKVNSEPPQTPAAAGGRDKLPCGTETILLVEDENSVRVLTAQILRKLGYNVLEAGSGEEAQEVVNGLGDTPLDLLLSDVVLPNRGGRRLMEWMEERQEDTKVLFISGYVEESVFVEQGLPLGSPFLQKPFTPSELAHKIREVFRN